MITGGDAFKQKLFNDYGISVAVDAYLADPRTPARIEVGKEHIDVGAAVLAHPHMVELLAQGEATLGQRKSAVGAAIILAAVA